MVSANEDVGGVWIMKMLGCVDNEDVVWIIHTPQHLHYRYTPTSSLSKIMKMLGCMDNEDVGVCG